MKITLLHAEHADLLATGAGILEDSARALRKGFVRLTQTTPNWPAQVDITDLLPMLETLEWTMRSLGRELERASQKPPPTRGRHKSRHKAKKTRKASAK